MKIVFLDRVTVQAHLPALSFAHEWIEFEETKASEVVARLQGASVAVTNKVVLGAGEFAALPDLKLVVVAATGYNNIDVPAARAAGVRVCNVPDYSNESLPEHVLMLTLALKRNLLAYRHEVEAGAWQKSSQFCLLNHRIADVRASVFGIIGYGALGQATARLAEALGARVIIADRKNAREVRNGRTEFEQVLRESDTLSLHCPLTNETRNLIGAEELKLMKRSAILINTARGGIVDEAALVAALETGEIAGAGFDVLTREPPREGNPLLSVRLPNLIITPHNAWASQSAARRLASGVVENIEAFARGEKKNVVT